MNDLLKTGLAIVAAVGLAGAAYVTRPSTQARLAFADEGQALFPGFADPTVARTLEVIAFDQATASYRPFKVTFDGTRWVIPSHHNYPADAQEKMAQAAAAFIGIEKEQVVSDRSAEHGELGVLDPGDEAAPLQGRGTRVTIKGQGETVLADLIIGNTLVAAPTATGDPAPARRYVRIPGQNRVYATTFATSFSTAFADWVETDLLKIDGPAISRVIVDRYEIDEAQGVRRAIEQVRLERAPGAEQPAGAAAPPQAQWTVRAEPGGGPKPGEAVQAARIDALVQGLDKLAIVGVRPKPERLAAWFAGTSPTISQMDAIEMQGRGFYIVGDKEFVANEGELSVACSDGVVYTLYFGEVLFGDAESVSAGSDPIAGVDAPDDEKPQAERGPERRYVFVKVTFDETLLPKPAAPAAPAPTVDGQPAPADPAKEAYDRAVAARAAAIEGGRTRAQALTKRFSGWYYVIDAGAFSMLRPTRAELIQPEVAPTGASPEGAPGMGPAVPVGPGAGASPASQSGGAPEGR